MKNTADDLSPALLAYLQGFIQDARKDRFERVLNERTRYLTCVLENIADAHNTNAVMRTSECLGLQDIHIIENGAKFKPARKVLKGSHKWLTVHKYREDENNTRRCLESLKKSGYRIVATSPRNNSKPLYEIRTDRPLAIVLGQEHIGISEIVKEMADDCVMIPMQGFTESMNISVAAAVMLHHLVHQIRQLPREQWSLTEAEKDELRAKWTLKSLHRNELLIKRFYQDNKDDSLHQHSHPPTGG